MVDNQPQSIEVVLESLTKEEQRDWKDFVALWEVPITKPMANWHQHLQFQARQIAKIQADSLIPLLDALPHTTEHTNAARITVLQDIAGEAKNINVLAAVVGVAQKEYEQWANSYTLDWIAWLNRELDANKAKLAEPTKALVSFWASVARTRMEKKLDKGSMTNATGYHALWDSYDLMPTEDVRGTLQTELGKCIDTAFEIGIHDQKVGNVINFLYEPRFRQEADTDLRVKTLRKLEFGLNELVKTVKPGALVSADADVKVALNNLPRSWHEDEKAAEVITSLLNR